jgi:hypothetical protein
MAGSEAFIVFRGNGRRGVLEAIDRVSRKDIPVRIEQLGEVAFDGR